MVTRVDTGGWPKVQKGGVLKHVGVYGHAWKQEGPLRRNFSFRFVWVKAGVVVRRKGFGCRLRKNGRGARWDWVCWDPWANRERTLVNLAARVKEGRLEPGAMDGLWGDHNNRWGGWGKLDWSKVRTVPAFQDPDFG